MSPMHQSYYCPKNGTVLANYICLGGYYCPTGTSQLTSALECTLGHMCPNGTSFPIPCVAGTYQDERGQIDCKVCPSGYFCDGATITPQQHPCPAGYYCKEGTKFNTQYACPPGTYSNTTRLENISQCVSCTPGKYCGTAHLTAPTGNCEAGYFCGGGSNTSTPHDSTLPYTISYVGDTCVRVRNSTLNDICPPGHYCPEGSVSPLQCPPGTNSSSTGLTNHTQCPPCINRTIVQRMVLY